MKGFILCFLCCCVANLFAQENAKKIFAVNKTGGGATLYGVNDAFCPVSISLQLSAENLTFSNEGKGFLVIPARTDSFNLGELSLKTPGKASKYSYRYTYNFGDETLKSYDTSFVYNLPFERGKTFPLFQGYNGKFSHQNEKALDFTMPEGTAVLAVREGIVIKVVQSNTESCPTKDCIKYNNEILIYHPDGTFALYAHIKYNGATVKPGDHVKQGDLIAYSGNTGWSSGPHLHLAFYFHGMDDANTIATKFKLAQGNTSGYLQEGTSYLRDY